MLFTQVKLDFIIDCVIHGKQEEEAAAQLALVVLIPAMW